MSSSGSASHLVQKKRVVIIGAGPTGLGAACRLQQLGHQDWTLLEASSDVGGLAASIVDEKGFTWDLGGHVNFSHYKYFDELLNAAVPEWITHQRESWVWSFDTWAPYPYQNNIHRLPKEITQECLEGLIKAAEKRLAYDKPAHFQEWIDQRFGPGLARIFMNPYNYKVWGIKPAGMSAQWMGERVALVDIARVTKNVIHNTDDVSWGPNAVFKFPAHGGTGAIWKGVAERLPKKNLQLNASVAAVNLEKKVLTLKDGTTIEYDYLLSTMPLDKFIQTADGHDDLKELSKKFIHSATHIVGIGLAGHPPEFLKGKCWMYFPESNCPFYRVTQFSHYSPNHVPKDGQPYWSLMLEICESDNKPLPEGCIIQQSIDGLLATKLIQPEDVIISKWHHKLEYGYPTPFLGRDELLAVVQPQLEAFDVYSRGRFGGWRYEVGNQDHSLMQGVEAVDRMLLGVEESTYHYPDLVNSRRATSRAYGDGSSMF